MPEITFIVDDLRGAILVENNHDLNANLIDRLRAALGEAQETACARPLEIIKPIAAFPEALAEELSVRIAGYYHDSLTEGPGRRSSVLFQFCPLKCKGFIYSLKWEKYYITHDRTEPTTFCNRSASQRLAQPFSTGFNRRASRQYRSGLSSGFGAMARLLRFCRYFAARGASPSDY